MRSDGGDLDVGPGARRPVLEPSAMPGDSQAAKYPNDKKHANDKNAENDRNAEKRRRGRGGDDDNNQIIRRAVCPCTPRAKSL